MASIDDDRLTCGVCLELFQSPKILPCFHTFCQRCLHNLIGLNQNRTKIACPHCRKATKIPAAGASGFQSNFYIADNLERRRRTEYCQLHPDEELRYYCAFCSVSICGDCQVLLHNGHSIKFLRDVVACAKADLRESEARILTCETKLSTVQANVERSRRALRMKRKRVEETICSREKKLVQIFTEKCKKAREEAFASLERVTDELEPQLNVRAVDIHKKLTAVQSLRNKVRQALDGSSSKPVLNLRDEVKTGRGSQEHLRWMTLNLPTHYEQFDLCCSDVCLDNDTVRKFIGRVVKLEPQLNLPEVTVNHVFRCCEDVLCDVHAICPMEDGRVWVAYEVTDATGTVALFDTDGKIMRRESVTGRVSIVRVGADKVWIEGKYVMTRSLTPEKCFGVKYVGPEKQYDLYAKLDVRYDIFVRKSGECELRSEKETMESEVCSNRIGNISCKQPIAMDASKDGLLFAVLEEGEDHVLIYYHGETEPFVTYTGDGAVFKPRDVCFCEIGGRERLVVADRQSDSLHVLDVTLGGCRSAGRRVGGHPLLNKPTALCRDSKGKLWIGCTGGYILTLEEKNKNL